MLDRRVRVRGSARADADPDGHRDPDRLGHAKRCGDANPYTDCDSTAHGHPDPLGYADDHGDANVYPDAESATYRYSDSSTNGGSWW